MANYEQLTPIELEREYGNNCSPPQINQGSSLPVKKNINQVSFSQIPDLTAYEQILEALQESQRSFEILMRNLPGMVYRSRIDSAWTKEFVSVGCYNLTGYYPDELIGDQKCSYGELIHGEDRDLVWQQVQSALEEHKPFQICYRITTASREEKWVWEQGQGVFSEFGEAIAIEGFITDITQAKRTEEELSLLVSMSGAIADADDFTEALQVAISKVCEATNWNYGEAWIPSSEGILKRSRAWYSNTEILERFNRESELCTFTPSQGLAGRVWYNRKPDWIPDVSKANVSIFHRAEIAQECGLKAGFGVPILCGDRVLAVLTFFMFESRQQDSQLVELIGCVAAQLGNVMQRKLTEAALREAEVKYRSIFENAVGGIFQTTPDGYYLSANPALAHIYGYSSVQELMDQITDIKHQLYVDINRRAEFISLLQTNNAVSKFESQVYKQDGSIIWISENARAVRNQHNEIIYYEGTVEDITYRVQAEIEVRRALEKEKELNELKSRFVSMVSHEFRTPLATILISSELLKIYGDNYNQEKRIKQLNKIQTGVKKMTQLVDDVLLIGKTESGQMQLNAVRLNLETFCQEILADIKLTSGWRYHFDFNCDGDCSQVKMDEKLLHQMLTNLLSNAVKYSPNGGKIKLDLVCKDDEVVFKVSDQGIGIPEADQQRLFEVFQRCENVGSIPGTGLGMAIVKNAVNLHGGSIEFDSKIGLGTTFNVSIPNK